VERVLELASITTNKNSIPGDTSALNPGGVRLGTPALTTRGLNERDFDEVAGFLDRGCRIAVRAQQIAELEAEGLGAKKVIFKDFLSVLERNEEVRRSIQLLRAEVETFADRFPMPTDSILTNTWE
jgi:glycine hydroxymethyltransferase